MFDGGEEGDDVGEGVDDLIADGGLGEVENEAEERVEECHVVCAKEGGEEGELLGREEVELVLLTKRPQLLRLVVAVVRDVRMTESTSDSSMVVSFRRMIDRMFTFSAMFSAYSTHWSPDCLPFGSFMSMKSGPSLLISSHSVLPPFPSEMKFSTMFSTTFELTDSSTAVFDASALFPAAQPASSGSCCA